MVAFIMAQMNVQSEIHPEANKKKIPILEKYRKMKSSEIFANLESQKLKCTLYEGARPQPRNLKQYLSMMDSRGENNIETSFLGNFVFILLRHNVKDWLSDSMSGVPQQFSAECAGKGWGVIFGMLSFPKSLEIPVSTIGTKEFLNHPITNIMAVRTTMINAKQSCAKCHQKETVVVGDQPVYAKMHEVRAREPNVFLDTILGHGGFHFSMS